jgi:uncharacterized protein (TIGR02996 family)
MAVYFVYRCHYGSPSEKHVRRFEYDTVLDWAKAVWRLHETREEANHYGKELFTGLDTDAFHTLFRTYSEHPMPHCPRTMTDVKRWFDAFYCEEVAHGAHHIQCLTEWGDNQRSIYVFDDHYRAKKPGKADFLLLDGWELPAGASEASLPKLPRSNRVEPSGAGEGILYFADTYIDCKYNLEDLCEARHIRGLRVPDLARYLLQQTNLDEGEYALNIVRDGLLDVLKKPKGEEAGFLVAIRDQPGDFTNWGVYSDWLQDRDRPPAGLHLLDLALRAKECGFGRESRRPELDLVKATPHMAQVCKHEGRYPDSPGNQLTEADWFEQFIFFDDRWAAAHPTLAAGILTFASRWDVLT